MNTSEMQAGREMDALVAERVMGFAWETVRAFGHQEVIGPLGNGFTCYEALGDGRAVRNLPDYSTDIAAAWEVLAALRARGLFITLETSSTTDWDCEVWADDPAFPSHWVCIGRRVAESAPLAICDAALTALAALEPR